MSDPAVDPYRLHRGRAGELDPAVLYAVLRLRVDVFVVEQQCAYPELDGRDLEPDTVLHWATLLTTTEAGAARVDSQVVATLRVLREPTGEVRIGRVATAPAARGSGLAARLLTAALAAAPAGADVVLDAQSPLVGWYARAGFTVDGPAFVEDGIEHVPMRRVGVDGREQPVGPLGEHQGDDRVGAELEIHG